MGLSKYDNAFKQKVLVNGIDKKVAEIKRTTYKASKVGIVAPDGEISSFYLRNDWVDMYEPYRKGYNLIDCAVRLNESKQRKSCRVKEKIAHLVINSNAIFITLTFTDKTLAKTTPLQRRRLVQRYLKANCKEYVANVDFGALNGREHYHAVVSNDIVFHAWHKYGVINAERVRPYEDSNKRLSRYITKLTNHALKIGAIAPRLIYSRSTC